jgi:hypothetical protein
MVLRPLLPGLLIIVAGVVLVVRGYPMAVRIEPEVVTVYGYLRTRRIRRRSVVDVTFRPSLPWTGRDRRTRGTPLTMFMEPHRPPRSIHEHNERCVAELRSQLVRRGRR